MAKHVVFKTARRVVDTASKRPRQTLVRLSDEAYDLVCEVSRRTRMSFKDAASEMILCCSDYEIKEVEESE